LALDCYVIRHNNAYLKWFPQVIDCNHGDEIAGQGM